VKIERDPRRRRIVSKKRGERAGEREPAVFVVVT
jgi:hypothetical protein